MKEYLQQLEKKMRYGTEMEKVEVKLQIIEEKKSCQRIIDEYNARLTNMTTYNRQCEVSNTIIKHEQNNIDEINNIINKLTK